MRYILISSLCFLCATISYAEYSITNIIHDTPGNGCTGEIEILADGNTGPYTLDWNTGESGVIASGETTYTLTGLCADFYAVTITNIYGCTVEFSDIEITGDDDDCSVQQILAPHSIVDDFAGPGCDGQIKLDFLDDTGPYQISWEGQSQSGVIGTIYGQSGTLVTIPNLCADNYNIVITNSFGCIEELNTLILGIQSYDCSNSTINYNVTKKDPVGTSCNGYLTIELVNPAPGDFPYEILWEPGMTSILTANNLSATYPDLCGGNFQPVITNKFGCQVIVPSQAIPYSVTCQRNVKLKVLLEGAMNYDASGVVSPSSYKMRTNLNDLNVIPGDQPYNSIPFCYVGQESIDLNNGELSDNIVDWVLVTYRPLNDGTTAVHREAALLDNEGFVRFQDGCSTLPLELSQPLYVMIEHRNHMGVMSPTRVSQTSSGKLIYDFTTSDSYRSAASHGQKRISDTNRFIMFAGDGSNETGVSYDINGGDKSYWAQLNGNFGKYLKADFNMDADVNGGDKALWSQNNGYFSSVLKFVYTGNSK